MYYRLAKNKPALQSLLIWSSLILFFSLASIPFLDFAFSGDDIFNSQTKGILKTSHLSVLTFAFANIKAWLDVGRIFIIPFLTTYPLFNWIGDNLILYNFIHWFASIISLIFVGQFLYKISNRKDLIILFISLLPFCWALYPISPWTTQAFMLPMLISFIMLTLSNYINFVERYKFRYLAYLSIFFILALSTYEIAFVIPPCVLLLNFWLKNYELKRKLIASGSVFLIAIIFITATVLLRNHFAGEYNGTSFGSLKALPLTFLKQLSSELPLMSINYFHPFLTKVPTYKFTFFIASLLFIFSVILTYSQLGKSSAISGSKWLILCCLAFQIIPATIIGLSSKMQFTVDYGLAHIPLILQQIGFCLMLALLLNNFLVFIRSNTSLKETHVRVIISLVIASFVSLNYIGNQKITSWYNHQTRYSRELYEKAIAMGLFKTLPSEAIILKASEGNEMYWNSRFLRTQLDDRGDILLINLSDGKAPLVDEGTERLFERRFSNSSETNLFYLDVAHLFKSPKAGYVLLAHIANHNGKLPHLSLQLDKIKLIYFAKSSKDLTKIYADLSLKYKIDLSVLSTVSPRENQSMVSLNLALPLSYNS
ncbi:MAG: hypothetical protein H0U70_07320 [Tatlockia sp.]|nr:hypothetical protein [Tatlockia sp.]